MLIFQTPTLAAEVRNVGGGSSGSKCTTKEKLRRVSEKFPGEEYWSLQRAIIHFANEHQLQTRQIDAIVSYFLHLSTPIDNTIDEEQLKAIIKKEYPNMPVIRKSSVTVQSDKMFFHELPKGLTPSSEGDGISRQLEELLNADTPKKIRDYLCRWTNDPKYHLSRDEAYIMKTFLYNPTVNVFQLIKEKKPNLNTNDIERLIRSALKKKILYDLGHDVEAAAKELD